MSIRSQGVFNLFFALSAATLLATSPVLADDSDLFEFDRGYEEGFSTGYERGSIKGAEDGESKGRRAGYSAGWDLAFGPAYDAAYDTHYPVGVRNGTARGEIEGFAEGYTWEPTWYSVFDGGVVLGDDSGRQVPFYSPASSATVSTGAILTIYNPPLDPYGLGDIGIQEGEFGRGYLRGIYAGGSEGYDFAYAPAYEAAYDIGHEDGVARGTLAGASSGKGWGLAVGFEEGFDSGYDDGFALGAHYRVFGVHHSQSEIGRAAQALSLIPEPSSIGLATLGSLLITVRRRHRV